MHLNIVYIFTNKADPDEMAPYLFTSIQNEKGLIPYEILLMSSKGHQMHCLGSNTL